jgi:hypothetical protein
MKTSDVLNEAADLIQQRGWTQGIFGWGDIDPNSGLCLEGGIAAASGIGMIHDTSTLDTPSIKACPAYKAVAAYLDMGGPFCRGALWTWNDAVDRTAAEVIEVLRAAAVIEAAREEQDAAWETYAEVVTA